MEVISLPNYEHYYNVPKGLCKAFKKIINNLDTTKIFFLFFFFWKMEIPLNL